MDTLARVEGVEFGRSFYFTPAGCLDYCPTLMPDPERPWRLCFVDQAHPEDFSVYIIDDVVRAQELWPDRQSVDVDARYRRILRKAFQRRADGA